MKTAFRKIRLARARKPARLGLFAAIICTLGLLLAACGTAAGGTATGEPRPTDDIRASSLHYQKYHDYQSLAPLIPQLEYEMTRSEVEALLGPPAVCPVESQCYYLTDRSVHHKCVYGNGSKPGLCLDPSGTETPAGFPFSLILVVSYQLASKDHLPSPTDRLSSFILGPVGE